jgi:hypothetical protein
MANTDAGWTHVDTYGQLTGWLCPQPRMTLAALPDPNPPTAHHVQPPLEPGQEPAWLAAAKVPMSRHSRPAELPTTPV